MITPQLPSKPVNKTLTLDFTEFMNVYSGFIEYVNSCSLDGSKIDDSDDLQIAFTVGFKIKNINKELSDITLEDLEPPYIYININEALDVHKQFEYIEYYYYNFHNIYLNLLKSK